MPSLSKQITSLSLVLAAALVIVLGSFGWWAASRIDDRSMARETRAVQTGLEEIAERLPIEQDSSAIWDDAVTNLRSNDEAWIAENLAEWMSEYFGHNRVYILDSDNRLVRAVANGKLVSPAMFETDQAAIAPLVGALRAQMALASKGLANSTEAVTGMGEEDFAVLGDGTPAIVSVRPIVPSTDAVPQTSGTEYLHISIRFIDGSVTAAISEKFEVNELAFERVARSDGDRIASPVLSADGRIVGFFTWTPDEPAYQLIRETGPAVAAGVTLAALAVFLLLRRLQRTSVQLENSKAHASFLAFHDALTKIPNRALFEDRLEQALANMRRNGSKLALHFIDLDRFKHVNDTLGHPAGDDLIRKAASRLTDLVDDIDTVARLGGDEFAIIQFAVADTSEALALSQKIVDSLALAFDLNGGQVHVGASVGVVVTSNMATQAEDLMRHADIALYEAKAGGRGKFELFADNLGEAVRDKRLLETDLREALNTGEGLHLVYQPLLDTRAGEIAGVEALVRWQHPSRGRMSPAEFIELAEERGLIDQLGMWVMREACRFAASSSVPWVAVNVSPIQFRDEHFARRVFNLLAETGLPPKRLEIEVTEGLLLQNSPVVQSTLMLLRAKGIRVALDDFGTGYSSITYLRNHGVDKLKIDRSFTAQLGQNEEIDSIVRSIIDLGRAMRIVVAAEGVETEDQRELLSEMGCNQLQGFLLSRPLTPEKLELMLQRWLPSRRADRDGHDDRRLGGAR
ncbi:EAL domain-containing protein (plasmid) [Devosia neptuniae]|uniref:EAL domain-containing protein n=1 Tax=Devosia neptuniae TaxID=191302 RepID=A0ABY6C6E3_9HYPH|nr:EAL domain-containing protein [Devosia neptuniae]UXN67742.1 EAL domain-containing protein [Devosia neptuniae]